MGRYIGPKCKLCRREGNKLFLKGERCHTSKCAIVKRKYPPGVHGPSQGGRGGVRLTEYGQQIRAKQSAKRIYGLYEAQFLAYFQEANRRKGDTGEQLLSILETRLDNVIYRVGWAPSRDLARQLVNHGYFTVNGKNADIPSYQLRVGDIIGIKKIKDNKAPIKSVNEKGAAKDIPSWMLLDSSKNEIKILSYPTRDDMVEKIDDKLIVEFYSRK